MGSVDAGWEAAFTELTAPELMLRKLVTLQDLTICLDSRNADGKIDIYQEPLLYRASICVRLCSVYDSDFSKQPSILRCDINCDKLSFSLTDKQLPMFIRLIQ